MTRVSLRQMLGATVHELPNYLWGMRPALRGSDASLPWVFIRNRAERLVSQDGRPGVRCDWQWTSDLHVTRVFPALGVRLMRRALADWPVVLRSEPEAVSATPDVSFVIGHRGASRIPHLLMTLRSLAGQRGAACECVVVEQSVAPEVRSALPGWARYLHTPLPHLEMPYSRSWAFNVGAGEARGALLVFHDNDMLVPRDYAAELLRRSREGSEVLNLKRFIFYLTEPHSARIALTEAVVADAAPERVVQNLEAGGSLAVSREAFEALGGFDESFVGWGGEDNELWDRAQARSVYPYGYLPILHLWHAPQPEKAQGGGAPGTRLYHELVRRPAAERIEALSTRPRGRREGPSPPYVHDLGAS